VSNDIFSDLLSLDNLDLSTDILGGPNLRMRAGGETTFNIENRVGYSACPADSIALTRLTLANQTNSQGNVMPVLRAVINVRGEIIGLLGENDVHTPLPCYSAPAFATWRTWVHVINVEFMNPHPEAVKALLSLCAEKGFVPYVPRSTRPVEEGAEPIVRKSELTYDREAPGSSISDRFEKGIPLDTFVMIPDIRVESSVTEYTDRNTGTTVRRPAFTSFVDTIVPNTITTLKAHAAGDADAKRQAFNRLSVLTGHNVETDWPHRPTLGYLTPTGFDEIALFPEQTPSEDTTAASTPSAPTEAPAPESSATVSSADEPFVPE